MARFDYNKENFETVSVCGIKCLFNDAHIDRSTVPEGKYQYEIGGDDDSGGELVRVQRGVWVNFFGTLICDQPLPFENGKEDGKKTLIPVEEEINAVRQIFEL